MSSSEPPVSLIPTYIPDGRFVTNTSENHAGGIWISTLLCLVYSTLLLAVRAHLRWNVFSLDDYVILFAAVLQTGEVVALILALQHGLGRSHLGLTTEQLSSTNTGTFVGIVLFVASTCFAKLSVILLMMRLFNLRGPRSSLDTRTRVLWSICTAAVVVTILWGIGSIIGLSTNCKVTTFTTVDSPTTCPAQALRWYIIGSLDVATEILLIIISIITVWPVQLTISTKISIILAFAFRLPCAALSILHMYYIKQYTTSLRTNTSPNPGLTLVPVLVTMQIELCWSIISATIPNLKSFVRSFNSGFGLGTDADFMSKYQLSSSQRSRRSMAGTLGTGARRDTGLELTRVRTTRSTSTACATLVESGSVAQVSPPRRPSRRDVDIDGIGFYAGIPAVPGFGARRVTSHVHAECRAGNSEFGASGSRQGSRAGSESVDGRGGETSSGVSVNSGEHIIRKDMQYEVRYETI